MTKFFRAFSVYAFVLITLSGCAALYRDISPPGIELVSIATPGVEADMTVRLATRLRISNPNSVALPVKGGNFQLILNDVEIGGIDIANEFTIPANDNAIVTLPATLDLRRALEVGISTLGVGTNRIDYTLQGHIDLGIRYLGRLPVRQSGNIPLGRNGG